MGRYIFFKITCTIPFCLDHHIHNTLFLRLSTGAQWGKFLLNSVLAWLVPAVIVTAAAVIDRLDLPDIPDNFKPGFGNSQVH